MKGRPRRTLPLAEIFAALIDRQAPVGFRGYDGSQINRSDTVGTLEVRSPRALRFLATAPGQLGLARAYIMSDFEIRGDLHATLLALLENRRERVSWRELGRSLRPWMLRRPELPPEESLPAWRRGIAAHTKARDARAIAHHYDLSNRFYETPARQLDGVLLCGFDSPQTTLDEAQEEKHDLVCRKLGLTPGQRLLDVGAGWGGLVRHAAEHYGVNAVGVTLSRAQAEWARSAIAEAGLAGRTEVRQLDYRDVREESFDAISSIGAMEHIGTAQLGAHFGAMAGLLRPEGRMLNHTITRTRSAQRNRPGPFIDRYVFPDGELQAPGTVTAAIHDNGLEVRHEENLREHYAATLREWGSNLERNWDEAVGEVGVRRARVWRLYMTLSRIGFETNRLQIHQLLGVRTTARGASGLPPRPVWPPVPRSSEQRRGALLRTTEWA